MRSEEETFQVDTRPTKQVVVNSLTKDAEVEYCIFDLIDNAIDAARNSIFRSAPPDEADVLPSNYSQYAIKIDLDGDRFVISDNCGGIRRPDFESSVLRFGETSSHKLGIGVFGVGLNRALFKIGEHSRIVSDTGLERLELEIDVPTYLVSDRDWSLPARELPSSGNVGTTIEISRIFRLIAKDFSDGDWRKKLSDDIGVRYGQFISKGLTISVNGELIRAHIISIRSSGPFRGERRVFKSTGGISVEIEFGQLAQHRFSNEVDYDRLVNLRLSGEYGWTVICNDRVILMSDTTTKTGWDTGFHTEFYGFAGIATFESADPGKLPWITTKNDVDLNNPAYQEALVEMRRFAAKWRQMTERRKRASARGETVDAPASERTAKEDRSLKKRGDGSAFAGDKSGGVSGRKRPDHHEYFTLLPEDISEEHCKDKLLAVVREAKKLDVTVSPYASLAFLRILFEFASVDFYRRQGRAGELDVYAKAARAKKSRADAQVNVKHFHPSMDEILGFMIDDSRTWGATKQPIRHSAERMRDHQKKLNDVIHNPFGLMSQHFALTIRNDLIPIIRHLLESPALQPDP